ncbi:MAG TPA: LacI family DNA-binding transcriptional regulator [Anaeromyxobacter sp.]|nr:LacI family DNA-binding transcriptional regulator [Anaeromyxobacter sp.]
MVTIHDVARRAGVSASTVSHVANRTRFVPEGTRARVSEIIAALGYRPNRLARPLRRGQSHTLGLILPDSANPFFAEIGRELETSAFEAGFSVVLCNTENDREEERLYVNVLTRNQVDGILLVAAGDQSDALRG